MEWPFDVETNRRDAGIAELASVHPPSPTVTAGAAGRRATRNPRITRQGGAATCTRLARAAALAALATLAGCQPDPPPRALPPPASSVPEPVAPQALDARPPAAGVLVLPSTALPPGPIYACEVDGARTPVDLGDALDNLCRRHPEMGPCQYERDACRRRGGRVYTANGEEVTAAVEAEYDRKVRRVRFQADAPTIR